MTLPDVTSGGSSGDDRLRPVASVSVRDDNSVVSAVTLESHESLFRESLYPSMAASEELVCAEMAASGEGNGGMEPADSRQHLHDDREGTNTKMEAEDTWIREFLSLPRSAPSATEHGIPSRPGAFPMAGILWVPSTPDEEGVELVEHPPIQPQPALQDFDLLEAYVVSDPVATATPHQETNRTPNCMARKRTRIAVLLATAVALVPILSSFSALVFGRDPDLMEHQKIKRTIVDAFGDAYFDNPQKAKALHWVIHEDQINGNIGIREQVHFLTNLVQRFSLVAFYFQTTAKQPWAYCNPPVGKQSDTCYYKEPEARVNQEKIGTRWLTATHECQWMGVICDAETKSITRISIRG